MIIITCEEVTSIFAVHRLADTITRVTAEFIIMKNCIIFSNFVETLEEIKSHSQ